MSSGDFSKPGYDLASDILGVWWLLSREDRTSNGERRVDPALGACPIGILTYAPRHFAAQFMKRDRTGGDATAPAVQGNNNTGAVGGYDACFGTYRVIEEGGEVLLRLAGALTVDNVGIEVSRKLSVENERLQIELQTTTREGEPIARILTWERVGGTRCGCCDAIRLPDIHLGLQKIDQLQWLFRAQGGLGVLVQMKSPETRNGHQDMSGTRWKSKGNRPI